MRKRLDYVAKSDLSSCSVAKIRIKPDSKSVLSYYSFVVFLRKCVSFCIIGIT